MKNNKIMIGIIGCILFLVYNIIVFIFVADRTPVFWNTYLFTVLAFLLQVVALISVYKRNTTVNDVFFGIPLTAISLTYLTVQILVGAGFAIVSINNLRAVHIVQIILLAAYLILAISALMAKNTVEGISEKTKERVLFIKLLENDVVSLRDSVNDLAVQTRLSALSELIKYSDPMSHPSLSLLEQKVSNKIALLAEKVETEKADELNDVFDEIEALMAERNRKCKILK